MKEGKKWYCWRYQTPRQVDVLMDDNGKVKYYLDDDGEVYSMEDSSMAKGEVVFDTEAEAQKYYEDRIAFFRQNAERIKDFLDFLDEMGDCVDCPDLKDLLPERIFKIYKNYDGGMKELRYQERLKCAVRGVINVAGITVPIKKIKYVKWKANCAVTLVLDGDEEIEVTDGYDYKLIEAVFSSNRSSVEYKH